MAGSPIKVDNRVDWKAFAARHNMKWTKKNHSWNDGAILGNGFLGTMIYGAEDKSKRNALRFVTGRTDVSARIPEQDGMFTRVPLGEIEVEMEGLLDGGTQMELDLYQAEFRGHLVTTKGIVEVRSLIHSEEQVILIELETSETEKETAVNWYAYPEITARMKNEDGINYNQYIPDIQLEERTEDGVRIQIQHFSSDEGCVVAYCERQTAEKRRFYLSILNGIGEASVKKAAENVKAAAQADAGKWEARHRGWWKAYYEKSFLTLPDTMLEGFYLIQMYKLACAARENSEIMDNQGPWMAATPWPRIWFNMNAQMAYSPVYTSNHLEIGESLCRNLDSHKESLIANVPEEYRHDSAGLGRSASYDLYSPVKDEIGNLPWLLHNYWRQYRYSMDDNRLREHLYPLLKRSIQYYLHILKQEEDGKLHLPASISPEYGSFRGLKVEDSTYDLSLLRWGCQTLLQICSRLGIQDEKEDTWKYVLENLVDYHQNETGLMIGRGVSMDSGHRHFSHLLPIFPLHLMGDKVEEKELTMRSLRHWFSREGDLRGFTFTGAASIAAAVGEGSEALKYVKAGLHLFQPNTMYKEAGPVIESPLAAAESIQDMLLQSWGREIRVFPAVPEEWQEVSFHNFRAEGAFLVSAVRKEGKLSWIRVESLAGEPCRIRADFAGPVRAAGDREISMEAEDENTVKLDLRKGEAAVLYSGEKMPELIIEPLPAERSMMNYFGENKPWRLYGIPFAQEEMKNA